MEARRQATHNQRQTDSAMAVSSCLPSS